MPKKPKSVVRATQEEIENLQSRGARNYMWEFPDEAFDGDWYKMTIPNTDVKSAGNSFRTQCHVVYQRRANVHNKDGAVFVRLRINDPIPVPKKTEKEKK